MVVPVALHALLEPHAVRLLPAHLVDETSGRLVRRAITSTLRSRPTALGPRVRVPPLLYSLLLYLLCTKMREKRKKKGQGGGPLYLPCAGE